MTRNGGAAKPCLSFKSRSEAIRVLRADGLSNRQIADQTGIPISSICALVPMNPKPRAPAAIITRPAGFKLGEQGVVAISVNIEIRQMLRPYAAKRGMALETLLTDMIEKIAEDRLADAVMDDGVN